MSEPVAAGRRQRRTRVVHLIGAGVGGAELQLLALLGEKQAGDVDHRVLLVRDGPLAENFRALVPTEDLGKRAAVDPAFYLRLVRALRRTRPDVLHTWTHTPGLWGPSAARLAGVTRTLVAEVGLEEWKSPLLRAADRINYRLADRVVGCAESVSAAAVRRGAPPERTTTVPLAVRVPSVAPPWPDGPVVLLLGRFDVRKGHLGLLRAVPEVLQQVPGARFLLAGPAASPEEQRTREAVEATVRALGLQHSVEVTGALPVAEAMARARLVVVPSRSEGLPNVVLEALAYGRPVVATAVGGIPEVVIEGRTGWLVPPDDPASLATALADALGDDTEARRRAAEGRRQAAGRSFARMLDLWHREYATMIDGPPVATVSADRAGHDADAPDRP